MCSYLSSVESNSEELLPECNVALKETCSKNASKWNMHGHFLLVYATAGHDRQGSLLLDNRNDAKASDKSHACINDAHKKQLWIVCVYMWSLTSREDLLTLTGLITLM